MSDELAGDLLEGAEAISAFLFGSTGRTRTIYHLASTGELPTFKLGAKLCARKSTIAAAIAAKEKSRDGA